ncbi:craniofacial development protein 2-like [Artemia franciscana]|uniref:craniofacial development protein 2-like n=1 Tax=Artemia franciscana TaxID=6661 RepID=UPI0032DAC201
MIRRRAQKALLAWDPVNPRIARLRLKGRFPNISIITVYAPTRVATDADKDSFYSDLEITMQKCPKRDFLILAGDWNSRVGPTDPNIHHIVGPFTYGQRCSNGDRLLQFVRSHNLFITTTIFS